MPSGLPLKWEVSFLLVQAEAASRLGLTQALGRMSASIKAASVERLITEIAHSITEAFLALHVLRGLRNAAREKTEQAARYRLAHDEIYRATFDSLYMKVGRVVDTSGDSYTMRALIERLRLDWSGDSERTLLVENVAKGLADARAGILGKLKCWRNKALAHRTDKALDAAYYTTNKVSIDEVEVSLQTLQSLFNELSYGATQTIYDCTNASPGLQSEVEQLFGLSE